MNDERTNKVSIQVALFCECRTALEHQADFVRCINRKCPQFGVRWEPPTLVLRPYVEPEPEAAEGDAAPTV